MSTSTSGTEPVAAAGPADEVTLFNSPIVELREIPENDDPSRIDYRWAELECGTLCLVKTDRPNNQVRHECAAWQVLKAMGWAHLSTPVVVRLVEVNVGQGPQPCSLREWQPDLDLTTKVTDHPDVDGARAAVFDHIIKEGDRHLDNFGRCPGFELYVHDHGMCFLHPLAVPRSVFVRHWDKKLLPMVVLHEARDGCAIDWHATLTLWLTAKQIEDLHVRLQLVAKTGKILA